MNKTVIQQIASTAGAYHRCVKVGSKWADDHLEMLEHIERDVLPSGSGIDSGCKIDIEKSNDGKVVIDTSFHHMTEHGMYDGWTDHKVIVKPAFNGIDLRITGRDRDMIKDYLYQIFDCALNEEFKHPAEMSE